MTDEQPKPKSRRGFASMDPEKRRAIARKGGAAQKPETRSFYKNRELAAEAGRRGGEVTGAKAKFRVLPTDG